MPKSSNNFRSKLEQDVAKRLAFAGVPFGYETKKLSYKVEETRNYTPDFVLGNGVVLEVKGYFRSEDRKKLLLIKEQHPGLDLRLVFQRAENKIHKRSKTTYGEWAKKHGFPYSTNGLIPHGWTR